MTRKRKFQRGYALMARPGKRKAGFYRPIKIKAELLKASPPAPKITKTLTAHNEFWRESSEWERKDGIWRCTGATGVLSRLKDMNPDQAKMELLRLGASWEWS